MVAMRVVITRDEFSAEELRAKARRESDGRIRVRMLMIAHILDGVDREAAARMLLGKPATTGRNDTTRKASRDWAIAGALAGRRSWMRRRLSTSSSGSARGRISTEMG